MATADCRHNKQIVQTLQLHYIYDYKPSQLWDRAKNVIVCHGVASQKSRP